MLSASEAACGKPSQIPRCAQNDNVQRFLLRVTGRAGSDAADDECDRPVIRRDQEPLILWFVADRWFERETPS